MFKNAFISSIILGCFLFQSQCLSAEPPKSQWGHMKGAVRYQAPFYSVGPNKIRFNMGFYFTPNWKNELEINNQAREMGKHNLCFAAGQFRWEEYPEDTPAVLILTWHNLSNNEFGWCAIKNTQKYWYVASDTQAWTITRLEITPFQWNTNGTNINISFRNPNNENGWTRHDIWFSFSFF